MRNRRGARVGIVSYWFNRGQAVLAHTLRRALDEQGHETFVLARPTTDRFTLPGHVADDDIWDQPRVTRGSAFEIPAAEYLAWARQHDLDLVLFFQNKSFDAIGTLREAGVATAGNYVWEDFTQPEADAAGAVFDTLFTLNRWSMVRYGQLGLSRVAHMPLALHPDEAIASSTRAHDGVTFIFAGGHLSERKPLGVVLDAFRGGADANARLVVKSQRPIRPGDLVRPADLSDLRHRHRPFEADETVDADTIDDPRITVISDDLSDQDNRKLLAGTDVFVGVSRWEGHGLHLYEAEASGRPVIVNSMEPYLSFADVESRGNCVFTDSHVIGELRGIPVHEPDESSLSNAFRRLSDPDSATCRPDSISPAERWSRLSTALDQMVRSLT